MITLTVEQLQKCMPALKQAKAAEYLPFLQKAMDEAGINTKLRIAAFLAQLGHESGDFRWMEEIWGPTDAQKRYEPPTTLATKLGNTQKGDGYRYRGRGPIQLTGRTNYKTAGTALGVDLEKDPDQARTLSVCFRVAAWFWTTRKLNALADTGDFDGITKRINGGFNGKPDRDKRYSNCLKVL